MSHSSTLHYLTTHLPRYFDLLRQMVNINSFTTHIAGVNHLGELTAQAFATLGFTSEFVPSSQAEFGKHLFLTRRGQSDRWVGLVSHLDTVFPPEEEVREEFRWREDDQRVWGPGTADIKGGTVVAYMVLDALKSCDPVTFDHFNWLVALDATEERLGLDFALQTRHRLPADRTAGILVMECGSDTPERYRVVVQRKGMATFHVDVAGKAAHAGNGFWQGDNAILTAGDLARQMSNLSDVNRQLTVNVGTIQGGTVVNRVPHECRIAGEMRAFEPSILDETIGKMTTLVNESGKARLTLSTKLTPWPDNPGTRQLFDIWREVGRELGFDVKTELRGGLSDANLLWDHAPTIDGLGPIGGNCHCSQRGPDGSGQEYAIKDSFCRRAQWLTASLRKLAHGG